MDPTENKKERNQRRRRRRRRIQMAPRSSLIIRFAFVCIVLAVLVMTAQSHGDDHHSAHAPSPHGHGPAASPPKAHAPAPSAATFSAYPQLIATVLVGAMSFVFWDVYPFSIRVLIFIFSCLPPFFLFPQRLWWSVRIIISPIYKLNISLLCFFEANLLIKVNGSVKLKHINIKT